MRFINSMSPATMFGTASFATDLRSGVTQAIENFNATKPVIGGKPVHFLLDAADDQADPRTGTTVYKESSGKWAAPKTVGTK